MIRYGNVLNDLRMPAAIFAVLALMMFLAMVVFGREPLDRRLLIGAEGAAALFIGPMACIAPTLIFDILVDEKNITHRAFGRWILSRKPIDGLVHVEFARGMWGAKLDFRDGSAIRFFGAHLGILADLERHLKRVAPDGARFD